MLEEYINQSEANAWLVSANYYKALAGNEQKTVAQLEKQKTEMLAELQTAMESGTIEKGSESWYSLCNSIDNVTLSIQESETQLKEYTQTLQQLSWEVFDLLQDKISDVTEEADFMIELLSSDKLYDNNGKITDEGFATMGLHGQNYNSYMYQSNIYADEIAKLDKQIAKDSYDQDLINRRQELLELQQKSILAAQDEKEAIRDLVSDGIEAELDSLSELIDKYTDALDSQKDLYTYSKKVSEQTQNITSLQKQLSSLQGDDSEETKAKIQSLKLELEEAEADLEETEYEKLIDDTSTLLNELYDEYSELLNMRLDDLDALVADVIAQINADATSIGNTIVEKADSVGYTLSDSMTNIWNTSTSGITNVIEMYGKEFSSGVTTTNNALNTINTNLQNMITQLNTIAKTDVKSASISSAANSKEANAEKKIVEEKKETKKEEVTTPKITDDTLMGIAAAIWVYGGSGSGWGNNPTRATKLANKLGSDNAAKVQSYINKYGSNGKLYSFWTQNGKNLDKYKYSSFKSGARKINTSQLAWTQEAGTEYIVRPSDGAILTPVAKNDSVLNASASSNIWDMANSPAEFIKDNLNLGNTGIPNNSSVQNAINQNIENITFSLPNVRNYEQLLSEMQRDSKFEKLILSMTVDQIAGKSKLAKGKSLK